MAKAVVLALLCSSFLIYCTVDAFCIQSMSTRGSQRLLVVQQARPDQEELQICTEERGHHHGVEPPSTAPSTISSRQNFLTTAVAMTASGFIVLNTVSSDAAGAAQDAALLISTSTTNSTDKASSASSSTATVDLRSIFEKAGKKALSRGQARALAAIVQVCSLMWLRTSMNYQYRYGGNLRSSLQTLWAKGGIPRLYQGLPFAIVQGPLSKFGDTAANMGILALFDTLPQTAGLPLSVKTACGSAAAGLWRILLMPIDTSKTVLQVQSWKGLEQLWKSVADARLLGPLYRGAWRRRPPPPSDTSCGSRHTTT